MQGNAENFYYCVITPPLKAQQENPEKHNSRWTVNSAHRPLVLAIQQRERTNPDTPKADGTDNPQFLFINMLRNKILGVN